MKNNEQKKIKGKFAFLWMPEKRLKKLSYLIAGT